MDKGSHQWWVWGPLVLMLVLIFVLVADLFTDKSSPVQPFLYFAEIALAVAGMFWELMLRKTHK